MVRQGIFLRDSLGKELKRHDHGFCFPDQHPLPKNGNYDPRISLQRRLHGIFCLLQALTHLSPNPLLSVKDRHPFLQVSQLSSGLICRWPGLKLPGWLLSLNPCQHSGWLPVYQRPGGVFNAGVSGDKIQNAIYSLAGGEERGYLRCCRSSTPQCSCERCAWG